MPSPPRIVLPKSVVFITSRTEQGLPFVCHSYMEAILWSTLARAQHLYPVKICHFIFMGNHFHMLLLVEEPTDVINFMNRVKTETAHAINRLLGNRGRHTIWCDSYDCVPVLTVADVIRKISYIYCNPALSALVDSIDDYPGVSSWNMYKNRIYRKEARWINRHRIKLSVKKMQPWEYERYTSELLDTSPEIFTFELTPEAWKEAFNLKEELDEEIKKVIKQDERHLSEERLEKSKNVLGQERIKAQKIQKEFLPKKIGRRMWCICQDIEKRVGFIAFIKELRTQAKEVVARWRRGDFSMPFPAGLFAPRPQAYVNRLPSCYTCL